MPERSPEIWYSARPAPLERLKATSHERLVVAAVFGVRELDFFAKAQHRKRARLQLRDLRARIGGRLGYGLIRGHHRVVRADLLDESGDHGRDLLAHDLGVGVLLQL